MPNKYFLKVASPMEKEQTYNSSRPTNTGPEKEKISELSKEGCLKIGKSKSGHLQQIPLTPLPICTKRKSDYQLQVYHLELFVTER